MIRLLPSLAALALLLAGAMPASAEAPHAPLTAATSTGQIDALVAPVALYPDALLMPLLMASSYPVEVAEAATWLREDGNPTLRGDALVTALEPRPWAPSVKALVPFPETIEILAGHADWSTPLGKAFAAAPAVVMAEIQKLRRQAVAAGTLTDSARMKVRSDGDVVALVPADPAQIYVPVYNPAVAYGAWRDAKHPPRFIEPPPGLLIAGADLQTGIGFSIGFGTIAPLWGWAHPDWKNGTVAIDTAAYNRINRYGPHESAATWHYEPHLSGYFHITKAQLGSAPIPSPKQAAKVQAKAEPKAHSKAQAKAKSKADRRSAHAVTSHGKTTKAAKARDRRKTAAAAPHHGKIRIADEARRARSRR